MKSTEFFAVFTSLSADNVYVWKLFFMLFISCFDCFYTWYIEVTIFFKIVINATVKKKLTACHVSLIDYCTLEIGTGKCLCNSGYYDDGNDNHEC